MFLSSLEFLNADLASRDRGKGSREYLSLLHVTVSPALCSPGSVGYCVPYHFSVASNPPTAAALLEMHEVSAASKSFFAVLEKQCMHRREK